MTISRGGAPLNIANGIREFAVASADALAVIDGGRSLTFAQLHDRSNRVAHMLLEAGLRPGSHVTFLSGNRLEYPEVAAGIAKAAMVMVPLNPRSAPPEMAYIVEHSDAEAMILDSALAEQAAQAIGGLDHVWAFDQELPDTPGAANALTELSAPAAPKGSRQGARQMSAPEAGAADVLGARSVDYERALAAANAHDPRLVVDEREPFSIVYTSGTTGNPKGVMISHRSRCLTIMCAALDWGMGPGLRTLAVAPMFHGAGFAFAYAAVHTGGTCAMLRAFDPVALLEHIERDRPSSMFLVPAHAVFLRNLGADVLGRYDVSSLQTVYFNAAPLPQPVKEWVHATWPHVGLHELYGSTEASVVTDLRPDRIMGKKRCVGPAWFMTELELRNPDGSATPPGEVGEVFSRSPFLMNGYYKNPEATAEVTTDDGFLSAGDLAWMDDDNCLYIVDRKKDMIISGGANVYPSEVEAVILRNPDVSEVAVIGVEHDLWGEQVVAALVARSGASLDTETLAALCREHLAGYKIPRQWRIVDALPRNAGGKILKRQLRDHWNGA